MRQILATFFAIQLTIWSWVYFSEDPSPNTTAKATQRAEQRLKDAKAQATRKKAFAAKDPSATRDATPPTPPRRDVFEELDPGVVKIVLALAKAEPACKKGVRTACAQLSTNDQAGRRQLMALRSKLAKACAAGTYRACDVSADVELEAERVDLAAKWIGHARSITQPRLARCRARKEPDKDACAEAFGAPAQLKAKEARLAALRGQGLR